MQRMDLWLTKDREVGEGWCGRVGLDAYKSMHTFIYRMDKQQGINKQNKQKYKTNKSIKG